MTSQKKDFRESTNNHVEHQDRYEQLNDYLNKKRADNPGKPLTDFWSGEELIPEEEWGAMGDDYLGYESNLHLNRHVAMPDEDSLTDF